MYNELHFNIHVNKLIFRMSTFIYSLYRISKVLSVKSILNLYNSINFSYVTFTIEPYF